MNLSIAPAAQTVMIVGENGNMGLNFFKFLMPIVCVLGLEASGASRAETNSPPKPSVESSKKTPVPPEVVIANMRRVIGELEDEVQVLKSRPSPGEDEYAKYYFTEYLPARARIQLRAFDEQQNTTRILIWVVVVVCLSGILLSGYQLWKTLESPIIGLNKKDYDASNEQDDTKERRNLETNLEFSPNQFKIGSSVVGLLILIMSIGYLYLFLKEAYVINVTQIDLPTTNTSVTK